MPADLTADDTPTRKKRGLLIPLLIGFVLAALGGAGGYWAMTAGPFAPTAESMAVEAGADGSGEGSAPVAPEPLGEIAFVPLETLVISLGPEETARHLMFTAELEVDPDYADEVTRLSPRVLDVLNGYLRVVSVSELSDPSSLGMLRAQMLRRIQVVTGAGRVRDLLVTQFVVN